ncbi:MAG: polyprenyl diphosphate synthase [archaeon]|nr:polyprenyl diphosphate synthase [archaeon]
MVFFLSKLYSIAFIPDGNRRFAQAVGLDLFSAYSLGTQKAWQVLEWLTYYPSIKTGTFYTLSLENATRTKQELSVLFKIFENELDKIKNNKFIHENGINLRFMGKKEIFPKTLQQKMLEAEKFTEKNSEKTIFLALGYNGQEEIVDAAKKIAGLAKNGELSPSELDKDSFKNFLYSNMPEPDLIVRTSGTKRLSGFLTYQSAYSELCFIDKCWPELQKQDLDLAIKDFENRDRKFGK